jgi:hypothetical protein
VSGDAPKEFRSEPLHRYAKRKTISVRLASAARNDCRASNLSRKLDSRFGKARLPFQDVKGVSAFPEKISNTHPTPGNIGFQGFFHALIPQGQNSRLYRTGLFA